jgi:hypothetical protein
MDAVDKLSEVELKKVGDILNVNTTDVNNPEENKVDVALSTDFDEE